MPLARAIFSSIATTFLKLSSEQAQYKRDMDLRNGFLAACIKDSCDVCYWHKADINRTRFCLLLLALIGPWILFMENLVKMTLIERKDWSSAKEH